MSPGISASVRTGCGSCRIEAEGGLLLIDSSRMEGERFMLCAVASCQWRDGCCYNSLVAHAWIDHPLRWSFARLSDCDGSVVSSLEFFLTANSVG